MKVGMQRFASVLELLRRENGFVTEAQAAQLLDVSTSRFRHEFTRHVGINFRDACLLVKLEHGAVLLRTTALSIPEISTLLSYSDRTKFEKAFKGRYGVTPAQYRHCMPAKQPSDQRTVPAYLLPNT